MVHLELCLADLRSISRIVVATGQPRVAITFSMPLVLVAGPAGARPPESRLTTLTRALVRVKTGPALLSIALTLPLLSFLLLALIFCVEAVVKL